MFKDLLETLHKWGVKPIVFIAGITALGLFGLSLIPTLNFIPKLFLLFVLTH